MGRCVAASARVVRARADRRRVLGHRRAPTVRPATASATSPSVVDRRRPRPRPRDDHAPPDRLAGGAHRRPAAGGGDAHRRRARRACAPSADGTTSCRSPCGPGDGAGHAARRRQRGARPRPRRRRAGRGRARAARRRRTVNLAVAQATKRAARGARRHRGAHPHRATTGSRWPAGPPSSPALHPSCSCRSTTTPSPTAPTAGPAPRPTSRSQRRVEAGRRPGLRGGRPALLGLRRSPGWPTPTRAPSTGPAGRRRLLRHPPPHGGHPGGAVGGGLHHEPARGGAPARPGVPGRRGERHHARPSCATSPPQDPGSRVRRALPPHRRRPAPAAAPTGCVDPPLG